MTTRRTPARPPARGGTRQDPAAVEQAVAQGTTDEAAALADQITALDAQIAAAQTAVQADNDQIAALQNQTGADGNPVDNTDAIAALQSQLEADQQTLQGLIDEQTAMQQQLDALNGTAQATGGTATPPPETPAAAAGTDMSGTNVIRRAGAALSQMRTMARTYLAPAVALRRDVAATDLQPVLDGLTQLVQQLQTIITNAGGTPPATGTNLIVQSELARTIGGPVTFRAVQQLCRDAKDGRSHRTALQRDILSANVRAYGQANVNEALVRRAVEGYTVEELQEELTRLDGIARLTLTGGRHVPAGSLVRVLGDGGDDHEDEGESISASPTAARHAR